MTKIVKKSNRHVHNNNGKYRNMFGIPLFGGSSRSLLKLLQDKTWSAPVWIATVNPEFVMNALKDGEFMKILLSRTSVNVVDGVGLAWAREMETRIKTRDRGIVKTGKRLFWGVVEGLKILGGGYENLIITGVELVDEFCKKAAYKKEAVFFLGGWGDRGQRTADFFTKKYPGLKVAGVYAGNKVGEDEKTLSILSKQKIDYLFVAYAMKSQEEWINRNLEKLKCKVVIGLGRTFDYYSGDLPRAPLWMRKSGLEWLYSLVTDKERRWRKLVLLKFIWKYLTY